MNDELYHHGIKGMHWGVRRYQNPDGTLTAAGKRRNDRDIRRNAKKQREWNAKNASQLSDDDLNNQILRLQREKQLKDLTSQTVSPGKKHAKDLLTRYGDTLLTAAVTAGVSAGVTARINKALKPKDDSYERMKKDFENKSKLADEGFPVRIKGFERKKGKWIPSSSNK